MGTTHLDGYLLFAGGTDYSDVNFVGGSLSDTVEAFDEFLTRTSLQPISAARYYLVGTTLGDYALFAGGDRNANSNIVDVYQIS